MPVNPYPVTLIPRPIVHLEWLQLPPLHPQLSDQEGIWSKHHQGRLVLLSAALDGSVHCVDYSGIYVYVYV
jgi:hypothetical protein